MILKVMVIGLIGLLIAVGNAMPEIDYRNGEDNLDYALKVGLSTIKSNYLEFVDAEKEMTCKEGYYICCAVLNNKCGCFKFKTSVFHSHFMLKNVHSYAFGTQTPLRETQDLELRCKKAVYTIDDKLHFILSLLDDGPEIKEKLEEVIFLEEFKNESIYCGMIGNDKQNNRPLIYYFALAYGSPLEKPYEHPQHVNEIISYNYIRCGTFDEVKEGMKNHLPVSNAVIVDHWYKDRKWFIICAVALFLGGLCYYFGCNASNEEILPDVDGPSNYLPSTTDLVLQVKEINSVQSIDEETTKCSHSVEHSNTTVMVTDPTINLGTHSSELNEQSKSEVVSSLQFTEEASIVEIMQSESESISKVEEKEAGKKVKKEEEEKKSKKEAKEEEEEAKEEKITPDDSKN